MPCVCVALLGVHDLVLLDQGSRWGGRSASCKQTKVFMEREFVTKCQGIAPV